MRIKCLPPMSIKKVQEKKLEDDVALVIQLKSLRSPPLLMSESTSLSLLSLPPSTNDSIRLTARIMLAPGKEGTYCLVFQRPLRGA